MLSMENRILSRSIAVGCTVILSIFACLAAQQRTNPGIDVENLFSPSGFMGDGEFERTYIDFSGAYQTAPHSAPACIKITYSIGPHRFAGIYWLNEPDNWGDNPGSNYSGRGLSKVTFWAKGELGTEVVEFKTGGINSPSRRYRDSFQGTTGRLTLTNVWTRYEINLRGANLSSVIGGFCWVVSADYNQGGRVTFYLDDIYLE
ncbi:MAG: hypothetical protein NTW38_10985 [Candidatus Aminicenantes bacterium]|nr:hypothetical protein [Candidatus Aminicenantes bacterium]